MNSSFEELQSAVLSNNCIWLRSFGCKVRRNPELLFIQHSELHDYNACIILSPPYYALKHLQILLTEVDHFKISPNIYVDEGSVSASIHSTLTANGFEPKYINTTMAGVIKQTPKPDGFSLKSARIDDFDTWVSLYSKGFGRVGKDAIIDRYRWSHAFRDKKRVSNWFIMREDGFIGVCQTCTASGVEGIYSFTIVPLDRNLRNLQGSIRALRAKLTEEGKATIYLELLGKKKSAINRGIERYIRELTIIRKMVGYSRIHEENN